MGDHRRLMHLLVVCEQLPATALVTDEQLAENKVVATDFIAAEEPIELGGIRFTVREEANPDRRIDQCSHPRRRRSSL